MRVKWRSRVCGVAFLLAVAFCASAQEPQPAILQPNFLIDPDGVSLEFAWRFAPGDHPSRAATAFDDSRWQFVKPALDGSDSPLRRWPGTGWFRRHVIIAAGLQHRPVAIRFAAAGIADVYLDGNLLVSTTVGGTPLFPTDRRDVRLVVFDGTQHVFAVRYVFPTTAIRSKRPIGFSLTLANPSLVPAAPSAGAFAARGAFVALPLFLALLHFALFAFDRRARENLYYAIEMLAFAGVVLHNDSAMFVTSSARAAFIDSATRPMPMAAILFGLLTYYAVRTSRLPRPWIGFALAGVILGIVTFIAPDVTEFAWIAYFAATLVEIVRVERSGTTIAREGALFFIASFLVFVAAIGLQILIDYGVLAGVGGIHDVYLIGVIASAAGMSLYLARRLGQSRVVEVENARKTAELTQARELQLSMLPRELPSVAGFEIAATSQTAAEVGGDYYDVRRDGDGSVLLAIGDATGHGLASGVVVTAAKALFTSLDASRPVADLLAQCDAAMRAMQLPSLRMCLMLARLDGGAISVASAAMPPLLIHRRATNTVEELGTGGLPLGSRLKGKYATAAARLDAGDTLLFASDGFAELHAPDGRLLGYEEVGRAFANAAEGGAASEIIARLNETISTFRGSRALEDDVTLVVVKMKADGGNRMLVEPMRIELTTS